MSGEEDHAQVAALTRQHFQKHDAAQMANDLVIKETLGQGTYGRVRLAELTEPAKAALTECAGLGPDGPRHVTGVFALKIMKKSEVIRLKQTEHVQQERALLKSITHPFVVTTYRTYQDDRNLFMLMEYVCGGELGRHLRNEGTFANETARFYAAQLVMALQFLHADNIVFRGLVPENLLIDKIGYLKLVDFGYAKVVEDKTWTLCGTPEYLAPEVIQSKGHGKGVDWCNAATAARPTPDRGPPPSRPRGVNRPSHGHDKLTIARPSLPRRSSLLPTPPSLLLTRKPRPEPSCRPWGQVGARHPHLRDARWLPALLRRVAL
mmetsp:Transcript_24965/g.63604  ORF Transcript_24965/g.63604 Transcript_24965/m.63604 type:complete len:321 (+) Transcript_24965:94-1056(+)